MIIKDKIQQLLKGYPTVSDKYNVQGGILEAGEIEYGTFLTNGTATGYYVAATAATDKILGIALAQNVKTPTTYPAGANYEVKTAAGETVNLLVRGFVAVEIDPAATAPVEGAPVYLTVVDGAVVTTTAAGTALENAYFTGITEVKAKDSHNVATKVLAEISFRM